ncbi:hypothetical protein [Bradyrhizobium sp. I71]|uniref:hypothetical protein n=1 Tax=Bradyrhizobium sp. I71 TaxID=2590772 RepID=UPI001EF82507|nr:hypothetical protein [Bradyrhizobium sp. I71]ULK96815.1 hypothetical protein FJV43_29470 [Bradyrhizobium sp. I71]
MGLLKPDAFTLCYFVLAGPKDRLFVRSDLNPDTNVKQEAIGNISLVILWSFLCHPSHTTGDTLHFGSTKNPPDDLEPEAVELMQSFQSGMTEFEVMQHWIVARGLIVENFREMVRREHAGFPMNLDFLEWLRFFQLGVLTYEHYRYLRRFERVRVSPGELIREPELYRLFERRPLIVPTSLNLLDRLRILCGGQARSKMRWEPWLSSEPTHVTPSPLSGISASD